MKRVAKMIFLIHLLYSLRFSSIALPASGVAVASRQRLPGLAHSCPEGSWPRTSQTFPVQCGASIMDPVN